MEWKTAKQIAAELGVSQSAVYDGIKRGGRVGGEMLEKGGPGGRRYRIKTVAKPRIPKPPLTISEEASGLDLLAGDVSAGVVVRLKRAEEELRRLTERLAADESYIFTAKEEITKLREEAANAQKDHKIDAHCLADRIAKFEKLYQEPRENFDIRSYLDGKVKEHVEMMIKATFELPDHGSDIERLGDRIDRVSDKLTERLDLWTSKLEDVDRSVSEYVDRELTRRFDVDNLTPKEKTIAAVLEGTLSRYVDRELTERFDLDKLEERLTNNVVGPLRLKFEQLRVESYDQISELSIEMFSGVDKRLEHHISKDHQEVKGRVAKIQDRLAKLAFEDSDVNREAMRVSVARLGNAQIETQKSVDYLLKALAEATGNGGEYRNQVNERLDLQHKIQCQQLTSMKELKEHAQDNVERILALENAVNSLEFDSEETKEFLANSSTNFRVKTLEDLNIHARLLSLESFEQEFARRIWTIEQNIRTLLGLDSAKKTPSAADIMKRTVKAASAFADAMKGDL